MEGDTLLFSEPPLCLVRHIWHPWSAASLGDKVKGATSLFSEPPHRLVRPIWHPWSAASLCDGEGSHFALFRASWCSSPRDIRWGLESYSSFFSEPPLCLGRPIWHPWSVESMGDEVKGATLLFSEPPLGLVRPIWHPWSAASLRDGEGSYFTLFRATSMPC